MRRIVEIEGLRGLLSLIVVFGHIYPEAMPWFWVCMEVFFTISGYLIGGIFFHNIESFCFLRTYFFRRFLRIWPLYYIVFVSCWCLHSILYSELELSGISWLAIVKSILFLQNIEYYSMPSIMVEWPRLNYLYLFDHSWSVAIEEQFYILAPIFLLFLFSSKNKKTFSEKKTLFLIVFPIIAISISLRLIGLHWWLLIARLDGFILGIFIAIISERARKFPDAYLSLKKTIKKGLLLSFCVFLVFIMASYFQPEVSLNFPYRKNQVFGIFIAALFSFFLVSSLVFSTSYNGFFFLRFNLFQYLGKISYSTYLWHLPIISVFAKIKPDAGFFLKGFGLNTMLIIFLIFSISHFSYKWIEAPFLSIKPKFRTAS